MSLPLPRRPFLNLPFLFPSYQLHLTTTVRFASTARRNTKRLRPTPDPDTEALNKRKKKLHPTTDTITFHPPPTAPNPYHTPPIFLPPNDPRRELLIEVHNHGNPYAATDRRLPPPVRKPYEKKYHLDAEQIAEIRRLRSEDPFVWTRAKLAEMYNCSQFFVGQVVQASKERKQQSWQAIENVKARWGPKRRAAREERAKRRAMWGRDE